MGISRIFLFFLNLNLYRQTLNSTKQQTTTTVPRTQVTRDGDSSQRHGFESLFLGLATYLRLACNDLRLDLRLDLNDLRLDLGLEAWWLATCTNAHFIHRSKTKSSVNSLINKSEHLLLFLSCAVQNHTNFVGANSSIQPWSACLFMITMSTTGQQNIQQFVV